MGAVIRDVSSGFGADTTSWAKCRLCGVEMGCVSVNERVAGKGVGGCGGGARVT